eukprot:14331635-Alexandrium_andersonii.AAC.1
MSNWQPESNPTRRRPGQRHARGPARHLATLRAAGWLSLAAWKCQEGAGPQMKKMPRLRPRLLAGAKTKQLLTMIRTAAA